jgi:hypothetical protein
MEERVKEAKMERVILQIVWKHQENARKETDTENLKMGNRGKRKERWLVEVGWNNISRGLREENRNDRTRGEIWL